MKKFLLLALTFLTFNCVAAEGGQKPPHQNAAADEQCQDPSYPRCYRKQQIEEIVNAARAAGKTEEEQMELIANGAGGLVFSDGSKIDPAALKAILLTVAEATKQGIPVVFMDARQVVKEWEPKNSQ